MNPEKLRTEEGGAEEKFVSVSEKVADISDISDEELIQRYRDIHEAIDNSKKDLETALDGSKKAGLDSGSIHDLIAKESQDSLDLHLINDHLVQEISKRGLKVTLE